MIITKKNVHPGSTSQHEDPEDKNNIFRQLFYAGWILQMTD